MKFEPGTKVEILERGEWTGPFTVTGYTGRTPDHLVLKTAAGTFFEHYNDAPFNTREVVTHTSTIVYEDGAVERRTFDAPRLTLDHLADLARREEEAGND